MLSTPQAPSVRATSRWAVWRSLLRPTLRVARLGLIAATLLLGAVPLVVTLAVGGTDLVTPLIILGVVSGAATGWIADDPIAELVAPCPVNAPRRIAYRAVLALTSASFGGAIMAGAAAIASSETLQLRDRVPEAAAATGIALATGLLIRRRGEPLAGATGVGVGVLGPVFIAAMAYRWSSALPSFAVSPVHERWWLIAACAALTAAYASRDPATRPRA